MAIGVQSENLENKNSGFVLNLRINRNNKGKYCAGYVTTAAFSETGKGGTWERTTLSEDSVKQIIRILETAEA